MRHTTWDPIVGASERKPDADLPASILPLLVNRQASLKLPFLVNRQVSVLALLGGRLEVDQQMEHVEE